MIKNTLLIFTLLIFITSCNENKGVVKLKPASFYQKISEDKKAQLIDVRTPEEFQEGYISGAKNMNINNSEFDRMILSLDKSKPIYVYCRSGNRSGQAAIRFRKAGFNQIFDLEGGIIEWESQNLEIVK